MAASSPLTKFSREGTSKKRKEVGPIAVHIPELRTGALREQQSGCGGPSA